MAIADLDVAIDHHRSAHEAHRAHADAVAKLPELFFQRGNLRVRIARPDDAQAGRLLAEHHGRVFRTAEPDSDDRRLTGKPALAEANQRVEIEPPDAVDAVAGKQHAIVGAEQATFMHGGEFDPIGVGMKRIFDLGGAVARAVARRSAASSATGPPSMLASLPILTYQRGRPVSPHMARRSSLAAS